MIRVRCPASCGEIFQGPVDREQVLISYAIDLYSQVSLERGKRKGDEDDLKVHHKAYHAMEETLKHFDLPGKSLKDYRLRIHSDIPRGKGMASSTADVAGAIILSAKILRCPMTEDLLGEIAAKVEPTDSTLFSKLSLFNSSSGRRIQSYGPYPKGRVLVLEGLGTVDTLEYHQKHREGKPQQRADTEAFKAWEKRPDKLSLRELARLATISTRAHQRVLPKPGVEKIIEASTLFGAYGVNTAHSGSVLGILYEEGRFQKEGFLKIFQREGLRNHYPILRDHRLIPGGIQWME